MNKEKEFLILSKALGYLKLDRQPLIEISEAPDFILTTNYSNYKLGVEITELYLSDTHARIANKKDYFSQIVNGSFLHNEDKRILLEANLIESCKLGRTECIQFLSEIYSKDMFIDRLISLIMKKENKCINYLKKCEECILLVNYENLLDFHFSNYSEIRSELSSELKSTSFKEIILIGETSLSGNNLFLLKENNIFSIEKKKTLA